MSVTVRYFAAAAEAAGVATETYDDAVAGTAGDLRRALVAAHGAPLEHVLGRCSLLAAGTRLADDASRVPAGTTVDVLPPFAGG